MSDYKVEYKIVKSNDVQTSTTQAKYVCPFDQVELTAAILKDPGLEFFSVRKVRPAKQKTEPKPKAVSKS